MLIKEAIDAAWSLTPIASLSLIQAHLAVISSLLTSNVWSPFH